MIRRITAPTFDDQTFVERARYVAVTLVRRARRAYGPVTQPVVELLGVGADPARCRIGGSQAGEGCRGGTDARQHHEEESGEILCHEGMMRPGRTCRKRCMTA